MIVGWLKLNHIVDRVGQYLHIFIYHDIINCDSHIEGKNPSKNMLKLLSLSMTSMIPWVYMYIAFINKKIILKHSQCWCMSNKAKTRKSINSSFFCMFWAHKYCIFNACFQKVGGGCSPCSMSYVYSYVLHTLWLHVIAVNGFHAALLCILNNP